MASPAPYPDRLNPHIPHVRLSLLQAESKLVGLDLGRDEDQSRVLRHAGTLVPSEEHEVPRYLYIVFRHEKCLGLHEQFEIVACFGGGQTAPPCPPPRLSGIRPLLSHGTIKVEVNHL